jgi:nitric oxide reductase activation protein
MNDQEVIAAEAYITAKALSRAGIPVRVVDFHSLRGYTVLEILKDYGEDPEGIFRYFAGGWNRDSAALKCMRSLLHDQTGDPDHIRLLFVLTDASPNDDLPIPPTGNEKRPREYEGAAGVRETAAAVKALREDGVCTAAVFHGASIHLENVPQIYGDCFTCVRRMRQLSDGIRILIEQMLRNYRRD